MQISIVANKIEEFQERINKLSKRLKREIPWFPSNFIKIKQFVDSCPVEVLYATIDIDLEQIFSVNGFQFYALVKNNAEVPVIVSSDKEAFKIVNTDQSFKCPHCNKVIPHRKNKIFLKDKDGKIVAFGSSCAQKYFGSSYKILAKGLDSIEEVKDYFTRGYAMTNGWKDALHHDRIFRVAIYTHLAGHPFVSKKDAEYTYKTSSSDRVATSQYDFYSEAFPNEKRDPNAYRDFLNRQEEIDNLKTKILEFYSNYQPIENFDANVKAQFERQGIQQPLIVYGVYKYFWAQEKLVKESKPKKIWKDSGLSVGQVVENLEVEFVRSHSFGTNYGDVTFYNFIDNNGSSIVVRCTGYLDHLEKVSPDFGRNDLVVGKHYLISKATVKDKKVYKDIPQTILKLGRKNNISEK